MVILPHRRKAFRGDAAGGVTNISDASYDSKSFLVTVGLNYQTPSSLFFTPDGLTMFMVDNGDNIVTYALSVAWDVSTAVYSSVKDLSDDSGGSENRTGMFFNPIGTLAYFASYGGKDIQRYTMSTGWNLSTIMPDGSAAELATAISGLTDVAFTSDGLKVFYTSDSFDKIYQHTLSSAWDLTTAGASTEYAFSGSTEPNAFVFNADGTKLYVLGEATQDVRQYSLSTPWDVTTISYDSDLLDISALENDPKGMFMTATKLYIIGYQNDTVYQYSL